MVAVDKSLRIVVPRFGAAVVGGAENAMRRLGHALTARGWSVQVWTTTALDEATWSSGFAAGDERDGDIRVRRFPVALRRHPWLFRQMSRWTFRAPRGLRAEHAWSVLQGPYSPSLIHALARSDGVPTLFSPYLYHSTVFGLPAAAHPRILVPAAHDEPPLRLTVVRRAVAAADAVWFHTPEERDLLVGRHPRVASLPSDCGVVGVEVPARAGGSGFAARHGISGPYLYYGGRAAGKGLEVVLAAARLLHATHPTVRLVFSGDARDNEHAPWVHTAGRLDEQTRVDAIAGAAAVVVPGSLESLSLLALDAWSLGRPCLLNATSTVLAAQAERSGGGVAFTGAEELASAAARLIDVPERAAAMGEAGRRYVVATYRWDSVEERLRSLLAAATR